MLLKATYIDMESAEYTAVLHVEDCSELGVREQDRVRIKHERSSAVAVVQTTDSVVSKGEVGILGRAYKELGPEPNELIEVVPTSRPVSVDFIKKKMAKEELSTEEIRALVLDIANRNLSNIELTAYVTSLEINGMNIRETADLTMAMVETGTTIKFDRAPVFDFHSIGGCPGNKITFDRRPHSGGVRSSDPKDIFPGNKLGGRDSGHRRGLRLCELRCQQAEKYRGDDGWGTVLGRVYEPGTGGRSDHSGRISFGNRPARSIVGFGHVEEKGRWGGFSRHRYTGR